MIITHQAETNDNSQYNVKFLITLLKKTLAKSVACIEEARRGRRVCKINEETLVKAKTENDTQPRRESNCQMLARKRRAINKPEAIIWRKCAKSLQYEAKYEMTRPCV